MSIPWQVGLARRKLDDVLLLTSPAVHEWITHAAYTVQTQTDADQHCQYATGVELHLAGHAYEIQSLCHGVQSVVGS